MALFSGREQAVGRFAGWANAAPTTSSGTEHMRTRSQYPMAVGYCDVVRLRTRAESTIVMNQSPSPASERQLVGAARSRESKLLR